MKLVDFEPHLNRWFIPMQVEGRPTRAYLDVYFEENRDEAFQSALEIRDAMTNHHGEQLQEEPMGSLNDCDVDFRCMIAD